MSETNLTDVLGRANEQLSGDARRDIIRVERELVIAGDPLENVPGRTVVQQVTNHQLTTADRLGLYREPGWHGLGQVISEELTGRQAVDRFIGWSVEPMPVYTRIDGAERPLPLKANVRSDTRELLGIVGQDYKLIQNADLGDFADAILAESKADGVGVRMETCGSLLGGRKVFLTMRPDRDIRVGRTGEDVTVPLLTLLNGHDGSLAMSCAWTFVRVVCNNTYTSALGAVEGEVGAGRGFKIRHMGKVSDYLDSAKACLGIAVKGLEKFQERATAMAGTRLQRSDLNAYFEEVYAHQYGDPDKSEEPSAKDRAVRVIGEWMRLMGEDGQLFDGIGGTLWAAFNAVTQWQDHTRAAALKVVDRQQHLKLLGQGASDKRKAMRVAAKFLAV